MSTLYFNLLPPDFRQFFYKKYLSPNYCGIFTLLSVFSTYGEYKPSVLLCGYVAQNGYINLLKWLKNTNVPWNEDTCSLAAYHYFLN